MTAKWMKSRLEPKGGKTARKIYIFDETGTLLMGSLSSSVLCLWVNMNECQPEEGRDWNCLRLLFTSTCQCNARFPLVLHPLCLIQCSFKLLLLEPHLISLRFTVSHGVRLVGYALSHSAFKFMLWFCRIPIFCSYANFVEKRGSFPLLYITLMSTCNPPQDPPLWGSKGKIN